jgi:hypothetical protein
LDLIGSLVCIEGDHDAKITNVTHLAKLDHKALKQKDEERG